MTSPPPSLGDYPHFMSSTNGPFSWGQGGRSSVAYGVDVLPDLVRGLNNLSALAHANMPTKAEAAPAVIGCVYRLTSDEVIDALLPIRCCIVVDRQQTSRLPLKRLNRDGRALSSLHLPHLDYVAVPLPDGTVPAVHPASGIPDPVVLGPVRGAGWSRGEPLVHVKMLVAGRTWVWEDDWGREQFHFTALRTWMGSANWTNLAPTHLEFGLWSDDEALLKHNQDFLINVLRFSQPLDSMTLGPEPELVDMEWDHDAFAEYIVDMRDDEA